MSSTMRTRESLQVSLKDALHLLAKLGKPGTLVSGGRMSCATGKRQMWNCLVRTSMGVFLIEICDTSHWRRTRMPAWWGDWGAGKKVLHDFACSCHKPADLHRRSRAMLEGARANSLRGVQSGLGTALGPAERAPKLVRVHNLRLRRKRICPEYDDVQLARICPQIGPQ
jgi:hypothetical protein